MPNTQSTACKVCFKCGAEKPLTEYYAHKGMIDGHLNKCKECTKSDVSKHRSENLESVRAYDRSRGGARSAATAKAWALKYPKARAAQVAAGNAIRCGALIKQPCEVCGSKTVHAHHDDYNKPLSVRWLCPVHHREWHDEHGEGANKE